MSAVILRLPPRARIAGAAPGKAGEVIPLPARLKPALPAKPDLTVRSRLMHYVATTDNVDKLAAILLFCEGERPHDGQDGAP